MVPIPGTRFGPYEVIEPLGEGGMGAVFRARDTRLDRDVAIKVIREDLAVAGDRLQRFTQEAKAASALNHPNIVTVYDIGIEGDVVYMVMELVTGRPLGDVVPSRGLPAADVIRIAIQVTDACAAAHARHIIHRDLKPANVMLQTDGRVKVLDFGLAKFIEQSDDTRTMSQTAAGTVLGTVAYMSPEQAEGKPLDGRSDIFSLGALLYELTTGQRAFPGDSRASVFAAVLKEDPPPVEQVRADVPAELGRLIMRCLRKDASRRVQSMADLRASLEELRDELLAGRLGSGPASSQIRIASGAHAAQLRRTYFPIAAAALVAAGAVAAYLFWPRGEANLTTAQGDLQPVPFTTFAGGEFAGGFSPDGSQLVFEWNGEQSNSPDIYVKVVGAGTPLQLTSNPAQETDPRWSPDGRHIAFFRWTEPGKVSLVLIPPLGGTERVLGEFYPRIAILPYKDLAWTPDSKFLLVAAARARDERNRLHRVSVETGEITTVLDAEQSTDGFVSIAVSHDGSRLATAVDITGRDVISVFNLSADGVPSGPKQYRGTGSAVELQWAPDSNSLLFRRTVNTPGPLYRLTLDGDGIVSPLLWLGPGAAQPVVSARAGRLVYTRTIRDANIWRVPVGSGARTMEKIAVSSFREVAPHYSPDGKRLAFHSNRSGSVQIWVSNADGSNAAQLTSLNDIATTGTPRWAADGKRLAFDSNTTGTYQIYVINADGGQPRAVTTDAARNFTAWWSKDGSWIYYTSDRSGRLEIWRVSPDGGASEQITRSGASSGSISPDGQWLYLVRNEGVDGLWRMPINGGSETRVIDSLWRFNYVATDNGVYYMPRPESGRRSVQYFDFASRRHSEIAAFDAPGDLGMALSPDGKYLLFTKIDHLGADLMLVEKFR